jgi:hypothetical protein
MLKLSKYWLSCVVVSLTTMLGGSGCAVPQPRGGGTTPCREPSTALVPPVPAGDYVRTMETPKSRMNAWPLVIPVE